MSEDVYFRKGDIVQVAFWYSNPDEQAKAKRLIRHQIRQAEGTCILGPIKWSTLSPEDPRVPPPPEKYPRGTMLLVGEAEVREIRRLPDPETFVSNLSPRDLLQLRQVTRRAALQNGQTLTDEQCDAIIEMLGPDAALKTLRMH